MEVEFSSVESVPLREASVLEVYLNLIRLSICQKQRIN